MSLRRQASKRPAEDEGAILILVLLFILVIGLTAAAVVTQATASLSNTVVVRNKTAKVYTADSGVEAAIQRLRQDPTVCPMVGGGPQVIAGLDASAVPGPGLPEPTTPALTVTCETLSGTSTGALGFGIVTTDTSSSASFNISGSTAPRIDGPVYAGRWAPSIAPGLSVTSGNALEAPGRCADDADKPSGLSVTVPFVYRCANQVGYASPLALAQAVPHGLPDWAALPTRALAPMAPPTAGCSIFLPGRYVSPSLATLSLTRDNFFASGSYYFENLVIDVDASDSANVISGGRISVVGGSPGPEDTVQNRTSGNPTQACSTDAIAGVAASQTGVTWILGSGSRIVVGSGDSQLELFSRTGSTSGTDGLSIVGVPAAAESIAGAQWKRSTVSYTSNSCLTGNSISGCLLYQNGGTQPQLSLQGLVWAPGGHIKLNNTTNSQGSRFTGGIVVGRLDLQNTNSASGFAISVRNKPSRRVVRIVAQAGGGVAGRVVEASAVVQIGNDSATTTALQSWRSD